MYLLLSCPAYRLEWETYASIYDMWEEAQDLGHRVDLYFPNDNRIPQDRKGIQNHLAQYKLIRERFLSHDYHVWVNVESDVVVPTGGLTKLLDMLYGDLNADVGYGMYVFRNWNKKGESAAGAVNLHYRYRDKPLESMNIGNPISADGMPSYQEWLEKGRIPVSGGALGILAAKRPVLEKVDFRLLGGGHCDVYFMHDVWSAGFDQWGDTSIVCGHKHTDGTILFPPHCEPWL